MFEFELCNVHTRERVFVWGYDALDAMQRSGLDCCDWEMLVMEYVD